MKKIMKKVMDIVLVIAIILLAGYFLLRVSGIITVYKVETGSMEPSIHIGDYILSVHQKAYYKDDVVTYKLGNYFITHRIIEANVDNYITQGDANNTEDDPITSEDIVGKVVYTGGALNILINYRYIIAGTMVGLYLISCYIESKKKKHNSKE